jgi:two-component system, cell cycle sensor histidine kinase and response regulator CckA
VYLPHTRDEVDAPSEAPVREAPEPTRGSETILLVEDDDQVRESASGVLRRAGYHVIDADSPTEALRRSEETAAPIHLLLTDVVLPRMSGPALLARLRESRPGLPVVFMSGYTDEAVLEHGALDTEHAYIEKPLTVESLTGRVREALVAAAR